MYQPKKNELKSKRLRLLDIISFTLVFIGIAALLFVTLTNRNPDIAVGSDFLAGVSFICFLIASLIQL